MFLLRFSRYWHITPYLVMQFTALSSNDLHTVQVFAMADFVATWVLGNFVMTESEVVEAVALYVDTSLNAIALYASFTFAYLTAAYFIGVSLTSFQVRMVTALYVASAAICTASSFATVQAWTYVVSSYPTLLNALPVLAFDDWHYFLSAVMVAGILASMYFMHDIRQLGRGRSKEGN